MLNSGGPKQSNFGNIPLEKRTKYFKSHKGVGAIVKNVVVVVY
jgi:hypothetical protein